MQSSFSTVGCLFTSSKPELIPFVPAAGYGGCLETPVISIHANPILIAWYLLLVSDGTSVYFRILMEARVPLALTYAFLHDRPLVICLRLMRDLLLLPNRDFDPVSTFRLSGTEEEVEEMLKRAMKLSMTSNMRNGIDVYLLYDILDPASPVVGEYDVFLERRD
ncbi:hypothetical protein NLJ89_g7554 [Agrocybe chaxingu]|uniref:Uncharacterized protein n=1 Tax=Agrocybe chaxingu TaxID=84603 RepID=A0A9W8JX49_9AGAR|nr:hypothetical protein NLJ89_g7554 [Agrocybe chaxingu]